MIGHPIVVYPNKESNRLRLLPFLAIFLLTAITSEHAVAIDPVRPGDQVEVYFLSKWYPGEVIAYKNKVALVRYTFIQPKEEQFNLSDIRFPNGEGSWMNWTDASGKFKVEARLVGRTETHVKLKKTDGSVVEVPIKNLSASLQTKIAKVAKAEKDFVDASFVRIGDSVEINFLRTWYPATVTGLLPDGATVEYQFVGKTQSANYKYKDMRYPNGEGPWADWKDITGKHEVKARYLTHDETDVYLLREGNQKIKLPRSKLAATIEAELAKREIITRRPDEVEFSTAGVNFKSLPSWTSFGTNLGENPNGVLSSIGGISTAKLQDAFFHVELPRVGKIGPVFYIDDAPTPMLCVVVTPEKQDAFNPISLYWIDLTTHAFSPGPNFFEGEIILGYSAAQQRLITAEGLDLRNSASRFCSYRLPPGSRTAKPEWKWAVPEMSFVSSREDLSAKFVGDEQVLIAYGSAVTMWNMATRRAEYVLPTSYNEFSLSPDGKFFFTNQFSHAAVIDTATGKPVASFKGADSQFTVDGKYVASFSAFEKKLIPLDGSGSKQASTLVGPNHFDAIHRATKRAYEVDTHVALIGDKWLLRDAQLYNLERGLLSWTYSTEDLNLLLRRPIGNQCLIVGSRADNASASEIHVGIKTIPSAQNVASMASLTDEQLYVLRPGIEVRLDASALAPQIAPGVRRAIQAAGWTESASSNIVIKAVAKRGEAQTETYSISRFGSGALASGSRDQTFTANPWFQYISVEADGRSLWGTGGGGMPHFLSISEGESLEAEVRKCEQESYSLFQSFTFPERVLAPKWSGGFGSTVLTPDGFIDRPVAP